MKSFTCYVILTIVSLKNIQLRHFEHFFHGKTSYLGKMSTKMMEFFIDTIFWSMIVAFKGGSYWPRATRIWQNVRHGVCIPTLTKSFW